MKTQTKATNQFKPTEIDYLLDYQERETKRQRFIIYALFAFVILISIFYIHDTKRKYQQIGELNQEIKQLEFHLEEKDLDIHALHEWINKELYNQSN